MQKLLSCLILVWAATMWSWAQQPPAPAPAGQTTPVRVPGQAGSPEELAAFNQLNTAMSQAERISLGRAFLSDYPNSGLSSYVHHILANAYGLADPGNYVTHAEMALLELTKSPSLLATLAFIYAETGKTALGAERGQAALRLIQGLEKPSQLSEADWLLQKLEIAGQSNYALGKHLLEEAALEEEGYEKKLEEASDYLLRAMENLPDDPYSAFRLAESFLRQGKMEQALVYFARTSAVGGSVGQIARQRLEELYQTTHSSLDGLDELLQEQQANLQRARDDREAMLKMSREQDPAGASSGARRPAAKP